MSDPATELKARLLLEELNRRNRWFKALHGNRNSRPGGRAVAVVITLFALALSWQFFNAAQAAAILMLMVALWAFMGVEAEGVHRRVDALVELLQQEGMLQSALPPSRETGREDTPDEGRMG